MSRAPSVLISVSNWTIRGVASRESENRHGRHKHRCTIPCALVMECIPTTSRYLQKESGPGKLESLRSHSRLSLSTSEQAGVLEGREEEYLCAVCEGNGRVEGCISGRKRWSREARAGKRWRGNISRSKVVVE